MAKKEKANDGGAKNPSPVLEIRLKPGHTTGSYRRAGFFFSRDTVVQLTQQDIDDLPPGAIELLRADAWLTISEVGPL